MAWAPNKLNPLASDENSGADFERQIRVELPHNRGYSRDKGCTECLPATILDSEVEEFIRGRETSFWDKRAVEQGLMIDPLASREMNSCGSSRRGGAAHEVEPDLCLLVGIDFHGAIVVNLGLKFCKHKRKKKREKERKGWPKIMWGGGGGGGGGEGRE